ncbi:hypothetical protein PRIPAC_89584 [Pristionchus pacificus]|uniref:Uncharacterized protein n=1 Tax=Pristionchus pacificus TaxID=54126 RepID=A0A2A6BZI9_PRIPA|nr:hypothetical protein PRIPAC_89584 [Pristionchus pacificus]|eukprot:PDM71181.1 hypothetical protein PRIPAC_43564 [Pristionchus pacificus]
MASCSKGAGFSLESPSINPCSEWEVLHLHEFCPMDIEVCDHEFILQGLEPLFDMLDKTIIPDNKERLKELWVAGREKYICIVCLCEVLAIDHPIGVFKRRKSSKTSAFVLHDVCFSSIAQRKDVVLAKMKSLLLNRENKKLIEQWCVFETNRTCFDCKEGEDYQTKRQNKLLNCSDSFCSNSFHWNCALKSQNCEIDFVDKVLYCSQLHRGILDEANELTRRKFHSSQSPNTFDICQECKKAVSRWPIRGKIFYLNCCDSFLHYQCAVNRLSRTNMKCTCGSLNRFLGSIQRQGHCLFDYKEQMELNGIKPNVTFESDSEEEDEEENGEGENERIEETRN